MTSQLRRFMVVYGVFLGIVMAAAITLWLNRLAPQQSLAFLYKEYSTEIQVFLVLAITLSSAIPYLLRYLRSSQSNDESSGDVNRRIRETKNLLAQVQNEITEFREFVVSRTSADRSIDTSNVIEELRATLTKNVADDIKMEFEQAIATLNYVERIRHMFQSDERRLFDQIALLRKRGNLNLVIGVVTTLLAAITLVLTVSFVSLTGSDPKKMAVYFTSRISTVVFIEVFSFFFLKLYKSTLEEEKYYQNEITARSARQTALEAAFSVAATEPMAKLIELLAGVNQNNNADGAGKEVHTDMKEIGNLVESAAKVVSTFAKKSHGAD